MPIETAIWRIDAELTRLPVSALDSEKRLETALEQDVSMLGRQLLVLGRQVPTAHGKWIDLLGMDSEGNLVVVELKRDRTPREVVAQVLDYASWVERLSFEQVGAIWADGHPGVSLETAFAETFGGSLPESVNQSHELVIVCAELDSATERILGYLVETHGVPINAVFFRCYRDGEREYLARSWLISPSEAEEKKGLSGAKKTSEPWNGRDYYVSLGDGEERSWSDCRRYGFISAGGGKWYTQTLYNLEPGQRVFVHIPQAGYVGIGRVRSPAVPIRRFEVTLEGRRVPLLEAPLEARRMGDNAHDPELCEVVVGVEWERAVDRSQAYWEKGFFALQHSACKLKSRFTIERLCLHFGIEE